MAQLGLLLGDDVLKIPWSGRSLRGLTRIQILLSSQRERRPHEVDPLQYDLFEDSRQAVNREQCFRYAGARLLLEL